MTELWQRSAQVADVSYPKRQIELVVMPYESPTLVGYHGRTISEVCSRGAFDGIERRGNRVRVNRDHDVSRTCGRAVAFHPSREEGLVAELYLAQTPLGDETLALADEGILDASASFGLLLDENTGRVRPGAEVWETRSKRRLNHVWLDHVALTPEPAYPDATVLAVRTAPDRPVDEPLPPTPNRDRWELQRLLERYAAIDARYIPGS